jgi:hypothetical protein
LETLLFSLAKNCRILQFKLRKAEKRNETMETEKDVLEGKTSIYIFIGILNNYFSCNPKLLLIIDFTKVNMFLYEKKSYSKYNLKSI